MSNRPTFPTQNEIRSSKISTTVLMSEDAKNLKYSYDYTNC